MMRHLLSRQLLRPGCYYCTLFSQFISAFQLGSVFSSSALGSLKEGMPVGWFVGNAFVKHVDKSTIIISHSNCLLGRSLSIVFSSSAKSRYMVLEMSLRKAIFLLGYQLRLWVVSVSPYTIFVRIPGCSSSEGGSLVTHLLKQTVIGNPL